MNTRGKNRVGKVAECHRPPIDDDCRKAQKLNSNNNEINIYVIE